MRHSMKRWFAIMLLGALGFAQASLVLAACGMDRSQLASMSSAQSHQCYDETSSTPCDNSMAVPANVCFTESTADLQAVASAVSNACASAQVIAWLLPDEHRLYALSARSPALAAPPKVVP